MQGSAENYSGVEGPSHIFLNIILSQTDDLVTRLHELATMLSFVWHKGFGYLMRRT